MTTTCTCTRPCHTSCDTTRLTANSRSPFSGTHTGPSHPNDNVITTTRPPRLTANDPYYNYVTSKTSTSIPQGTTFTIDHLTTVKVESGYITVSKMKLSIRKAFPAPKRALARGQCDFAWPENDGRNIEQLRDMFNRLKSIAKQRVGADPVYLKLNIKCGNCIPAGDHGNYDGTPTGNLPNGGFWSQKKCPVCNGFKITRADGTAFTDLAALRLSLLHDIGRVGGGTAGFPSEDFWDPHKRMAAQRQKTEQDRERLSAEVVQIKRNRLSGETMGKTNAQRADQNVIDCDNARKGNKEKFMATLTSGYNPDAPKATPAEIEAKAVKGFGELDFDFSKGFNDRRLGSLEASGDLTVVQECLVGAFLLLLMFMVYLFTRRFTAPKASTAMRIVRKKAPIVHKLL